MGWVKARKRLSVLREKKINQKIIEGPRREAKGVKYSVPSNFSWIRLFLAVAEDSMIDLPLESRIRISCTQLEGSASWRGGGRGHGTSQC